MPGSHWRCALELRSDRSVAAGGFADLCGSIDGGADLRVLTQWRYEEHIAPDLPADQPADPADAGLLEEVIDFRQTFLVDNRYAAGVTTLRQPILPYHGFNGPVARTSFFLYGMDGLQGCANLALEPGLTGGVPGSRRLEPPPARMPRMSATEVFDEGTAGPSRNFVYDMGVYRYFIRDDWEMVYAHDARGRPVAGSWDALYEAHRSGRELKAGISSLCADRGDGPPHTVFTPLGSGWASGDKRVYEVLTHPLVRVRPAVPLCYGPCNWDVAWVFLRTDGRSELRTLDPITRRWRDRSLALACRWFAR